MMELEDCAFPLVAGMAATDDPRIAFKDIDVGLLVGSRPRGKGMERRDLLAANAEIFKVQGRALNEAAKVLVVGQSCQYQHLYLVAERAGFPGRQCLR